MECVYASISRPDKLSERKWLVSLFFFQSSSPWITFKINTWIHYRKTKKRENLYDVCLKMTQFIYFYFLCSLSPTRYQELLTQTVAVYLNAPLQSWSSACWPSPQPAPASWRAQSPGRVWEPAPPRRSAAGGGYERASASDPEALHTATDRVRAAHHWEKRAKKTGSKHGRKWRVHQWEVTGLMMSAARAGW